MKLRIGLVVLSCALSVLIGLLLSRGGAPATAAAARARPLIGLSMDTLKEERWQGDRNMIVKRAGELGADVQVQSANGDDSRQIGDVQALITAKVDALVIIAHNGAAMAKAVEMAHQANIPVLAYDRLITNSDLDLYMTFDNVKVGQLQAGYLISKLAASPGKKRIVRIYGAKTDNNAALFKQGQDAALAPVLEKAGIEVIHEDWADDWRPENAKKIVNAAITRANLQGVHIDGILASNDGTATGAIQALTEEGLAGKVLVTGQDADLVACQRIVAGTQTMTIYKPLTQLATRAAEYAVKLAKRQPVIAANSINNGKTMVPSVFLDVIAVDRDNMRATVIKDGFQKEAEVYKADAK